MRQIDGLRLKKNLETTAKTTLGRRKFHEIYVRRPAPLVNFFLNKKCDAGRNRPKITVQIISLPCALFSVLGQCIADLAKFLDAPYY